jgi:hypothetical protein
MFIHNYYQYYLIWFPKEEENLQIMALQVKRMITNITDPGAGFYGIFSFRNPLFLRGNTW